MKILGKSQYLKGPGYTCYLERLQVAEKAIAAAGNDRRRPEAIAAEALRGYSCSQDLLGL